jgi:uncharacterized protein (DUF305 family)
MRRWAAPPLAPVLAALAASGIAGAPAFGQVHGAMDHHDHAGMTTAAPVKPAAARPAQAQPPPLYTADDLAFLQHMTLHHQQAIDMGALMEGRAERAQLIRFAGLLADAQRAEIAAMQDMLDLAAARGLTAPAHHMHGDPPMAGMLSQAEMAALAAATGPAFERLWLEGMIVHHEGGLAMARAQELRQALDGRQPSQLAGMVDDILVVQRAEIGMMRNWLTAWDLADPGDHRPPAVQVQSPAPGEPVRAGASTSLLGVAVDDTGIAAVDVAVHDLKADRWLRRDGTWGGRQSLPSERIGSGPAGVAWRLDFIAPSPGQYAVTVEATDLAGKPAAAPEPWLVEAR